MTPSLVRPSALRKAACGLLLLATACSDGAQAPGSARGARRPSILLVTIDTLRADHLGCYGYGPYDEPVSPAIDALAGEGLRLENCFVPRGQTAPSLCSLMLGKYPSRHGVRENGQPFVEPQATLAEHLSRLGYRTAAFVSRLPASPDGNPAQGVETFVGGSARAQRSQAESDALVTQAALAWLDERAAADEAPFFCWLHLYDVHQPYTPVPPLDRRFTRGYRGDLRDGKRPDWPAIDARLTEAARTGMPLSPEDHAYVIGLYDGGVRAADQLVALALAKLEERGLARETLVIVTADHGDELGDHGAYYYHGNSVYDGTLRVPCILRWPGVLEAGRTFEPLVQSVDLLPTLLDWLGTDIPADVEGVSLAPWLGPGATAPTDPPRARVWSEWQNLIWTVRDDTHKYVFNPDGAHPRKPPYDRLDHGFRIRCQELYAVDVDPSEQVDLADREPTVRARLQRSLDEHLGRPGCLTDWSVVEDQGVAENLASLGYIGTDVERSDVLIGADECGQER